VTNINTNISMITKRSTIMITSIVTDIATAILTFMIIVTNIGTTTNMDIVMAMLTGTRLVSMIRNTQRSLIAERREFALISPRNWLKC
jgi:hypothetical protein